MVKCEGNELKIEGDLIDVLRDLYVIIDAIYELAKEKDPDNYDSICSFIDESIISAICIEEMDSFEAFKIAMDNQRKETFNEAVRTVRDSINFIRKMGKR